MKSGIGCARAVEVEEVAVASRPVIPVGTSSMRSSPVQKRLGVAGLVVVLEVEEALALGSKRVGWVEVVGGGIKVERMWWRL